MPCAELAKVRSIDQWVFMLTARFRGLRAGVVNDDVLSKSGARRGPWLVSQSSATKWPYVKSWNHGRTSMWSESVSSGCRYSWCRSRRNAITAMEGYVIGLSREVQ